MSRNVAKIRAGLNELLSKPEVIITGKVISVDTDHLTINVQPNNDEQLLEGVMLNTIIDNSQGFILFPATGSDVIVSSVDGAGESCLVKASNVTNATITINDVIFEINENEVTIKNGQSIFNVSSEAFKVNTQNESLYKLLKDCFTYLTQLTVPTPSGTSSIPVNVNDFTNLISRIDNLLTE